MTMDESSFESLSGETLDGYFDRIDEAIGDDHDVDVENGILTIALEQGGQFVLNKHAPNRQLWLSSPKSGASHYDWNGEAWVDTRDGTALSERLASELSALTGGTVEL